MLPEAAVRCEAVSWLTLHRGRPALQKGRLVRLRGRLGRPGSGRAGKGVTEGSFEVCEMNFSVLP